MEYSVLQGSVLGPLLFTIYTTSIKIIFKMIFIKFKNTELVADSGGVGWGHNHIVNESWYEIMYWNFIKLVANIIGKDRLGEKWAAICMAESMIMVRCEQCRNYCWISAHEDKPTTHGARCGWRSRLSCDESVLKFIMREHLELQINPLCVKFNPSTAGAAYIWVFIFY